MHHYHHQLVGALVRGAGWSAGRDIERGMGPLIFLVLALVALAVSMLARRGR